MDVNGLVLPCRLGIHVERVSTDFSERIGVIWETLFL